MRTLARRVTPEDYAVHPGDCHARVEGGVWTVCCADCAGTGWFDGTHPGEEPWGFPDPTCKGTGRALITFAQAAS